MKLYLKGERCFTDKCAFNRRPYPPGQHGQGRIKLSEYGIRLREKQKMRRIYGLLEKQFRALLRRGDAPAGAHGRGDARAHRAPPRQRRLPHGLRGERAQGRQLVRHNHVLVNGKRVNIPSFRVKPSDKLEIAEKSKKIGFVAAALAAAEGRPRGTWLEVDKDGMSGTFRSMPVRDEMNEPMVREQYVVEYYSR